MDRLVLTYTSPFPNDSRDSGEDNPANRALNSLLEDGKPINTFGMCHLKNPPEAHIPEELRWIGVFLHSTGGRILYFPGFVYEKFLAFQGKNRRDHPFFPIDHVSLDSGFRKWHVTSFKSKKHLGSPRTLPLGENRFLWFGLSVANLNVFRHVSHHTEISVSTPPSDSRRRVDEFINARENIEDLMVGLPQGATTMFDPFYLHLAVIVGPRGFNNYKGPKLGFPEGSPFLTSQPPDGMISIPTRLHRLSINSEIDLQIVTACLPGTISVPAAFTGIEGF